METIKKIKYGDVIPSKILLADGSECDRVYVGDTIVWNKNDYAFVVNPTTLDADSKENTFYIGVTSTNDGGSIIVPYTTETTADWITIAEDGDEIKVSPDNEPREGATEKINVYNDAYITNVGGTLELPEIKSIWTNSTPRVGVVTYKQGDDSELTQTLTITQKVGSGTSTYTLSSNVDWIHVDENNVVTVDVLDSETGKRNGTLTVTSPLTGTTATLTVYQENKLEQKKEYGILSALHANKLTIGVDKTEGNAEIGIYYRYYQINVDTQQRVSGSETSWTATDIASWTVNYGALFKGSINSSKVTCTSNVHNISEKVGDLTYTIIANTTDFTEDEISSVKTVTISVTQNGDTFTKDGEVLNEYIIDGGSVSTIDAVGNTVTATINGKYRSYKIWASDNTKYYFNGENYLDDNGATYVSSYVSGYAFTYDKLNVSSVPNTDATAQRTGVGRFVSNRTSNGSTLYIDLTISQNYREKTEEYRFVKPELTVNAKATETWDITAAVQNKTFPINCKVLRQYKWTDGNWYDANDGVKENWGYTVDSTTWCTSSVDLTSRTVTLNANANTDETLRTYTFTIKQNEDSHLESPLTVNINVNQAGRVPKEQIQPTDSVYTKTDNTRLKNCTINVSPANYSPTAANQTNKTFQVNSTAIVEYLYTDGNWYGENRYNIGYTVNSDSTDWCTSSALESTKNASITVLANNSESARSATVTIAQNYAAYDASSVASCTVNVLQSGREIVSPEQVQYQNNIISATLDSYEFGYAEATATFNVTSTADKYSLYTDGRYYKTKSSCTLPYESSPTVGSIRTNGANILTVEQFNSTDDLRTQDITFTQKDENGTATGYTDTKTITQTGDAPVSPEAWEDRNFVLTVTPTVWNIDAAEHTSTDFTYVSTKDRYQQWNSGWKKMSTVDVDVAIKSDSSSDSIKIVSASNGKLTLSATANNDTINPRTKSLTIVQSGSSKEASILVTQSAATIVSPEQSKMDANGYVFTLDPSSISWLQSSIEEKATTVTSYGYKLYQYSDGVWRGKVNKTTQGDKVEFTNVNVNSSSHWAVKKNGLTISFTPNSTADKDYGEVITLTQIDNDNVLTGKTASITLTHKHATKVSPETTKRQNYSINITSPSSKTLSITDCTAKTTSMSVQSVCDVYCLYDDGEYYYDRQENVDYLTSPTTKQGTNNYVYSDGTTIYTRNQYSTTALTKDITVTQNVSGGASATLSVTVAADSKSSTKNEYRINSVTVDTIPYSGSAVTAKVDSQVRTYKTWNSDGTITDQSSWSTDSTATISSTFVSGSTEIKTNGSAQFSASENTGSSERTAIFKITNSNGASYNVTLTQTTHIYTKYSLSVSPTSKTFSDVTNGSVTLAISCKYCICNGGTDGTWYDCGVEYTTSGDVKYNSSTKIATLPTNVHETTALSGSITFTPTDMSATTGYAGTLPTETVKITGYADTILSASEYKISSASVSAISYTGGSEDVSITCQKQDYKYWKSGGTSDRYETTKTWYTITTPSGVTSSRSSGSTAFSSSGTTITASSNEGTTTSNTEYQLTVSGGESNIAYNSKNSSTMTVTQEYRTGTGRESTLSRKADFTITVPFPTGNQTTKVTATQNADSGSSISYPSSWSRDTTKNHELTHTGTDFVTVDATTSKNGVWSYNCSWDSNEGTASSDTDYSMTLNKDSLSWGYSSTSSKSISVTNQYRKISKRAATNSRTETIEVSYNSKTGSASFTQNGDSGYSNTGEWTTDSEASVSSATLSDDSDFKCNYEGNTVSVSPSTTNYATRASHTFSHYTYGEYTHYSYSLSISDKIISYDTTSVTPSVSATETTRATKTAVYNDTYTKSSKRSGTITIKTNRGESATCSLSQDGQDGYTDTSTSDDGYDYSYSSYTPSLTWSTTPSGSWYSAGTAPSISCDTNSATSVNADVEYTITPSSSYGTSFASKGGTTTLSYSATVQNYYTLKSSSSRKFTATCKDSISGKTASFTVTQNGQTVDESTKHKGASSPTTLTGVSYDVSGTGFSVSGSTLNVGSNESSSTTKVYGISVSPTSGSITVGSTATPAVTVKEATKTQYSTTSSRSATVYCVYGGTKYGSLSLTQEGSTRTDSSETEYTTSSVGYTSKSSSTSVATVSGNTITGKSAGSATITFTCNGETAGTGKSLTATYKVTVPESTLPNVHIVIAANAFPSGASTSSRTCYVNGTLQTMRSYTTRYYTSATAYTDFYEITALSLPMTDASWTAYRNLKNEGDNCSLSFTKTVTCGKTGESQNVSNYYSGSCYYAQYGIGGSVVKTAYISISPYNLNTV